MDSKTVVLVCVIKSLHIHFRLATIPIFLALSSKTEKHYHEKISLVATE
jgi:hypothetical protein